MRILFLDSTHPILEEGLKKQGHVIEFDYTSSSQEIGEKLGNYEGLIIRSRMPINKALLERASQLKFIGRYGAGLENIDVDFAQSKGITCIRVPEGNRDAVGEHAMGMLLSLFNHLRRADSEVRNGVWKRAENTGIELQGKTIGVIGYGHMGSAFVEKLRGFDVPVLIYDKYKSNYAPDWTFETSLRAIFEEADVLSLHIPLTSETQYLVNRDFILQFRKPFYLVNTARGPIVETAALVDGLKSKKVLGACLDVLEYEKSSFENLFADEKLPEPLQYLIAAENVILTPHIAGWSKQSFEKMAKVMLDKIEIIGRRT
jgi:D-3-phosphoglycerate dehydrogenase